MSTYIAALEAAALDRHTHYERATQQTRAHFAAHPECMRVILDVDSRGEIQRGQQRIDVSARCCSGWLTDTMMQSGPAHLARPLEACYCEETVCWQTKPHCVIDLNLLMQLYLGALGGESDIV